MAENSVSAQETKLKFLDKVRSIIPNITPDLMEKLFGYLGSAGVHSEADISKVDEHQLAGIIGRDDAKKLLDYFKQQEPSKVNPPSSSGVNRSPPLAEACPPTLAVAGSHGGGPDYIPQFLDMILKMQTRQCEKDEKILTGMQESQEKSLEAITTAMTNMNEMHTKTLGKMGEQMTEQSNMHQKTISAMNEQLQATTQKHGDTLREMEKGRLQTQQTNAATLKQVTQTMRSAMEAQEKSMNEYRRSLAKRDDDNCAIM